MFRHYQALSKHFHNFHTFSKFQNSRNFSNNMSYYIFMSLAGHVHVIFMPLSCRPRTWLPKLFHDTFMADSWHFPLKTPKFSKSIISSYSCHIHVTFMAWLQPLSCHFHGTFSKTPKLSDFSKSYSCHFHAFSLKFKIVKIRYSMFMSDSCHFHKL